MRSCRIAVCCGAALLGATALSAQDPDTAVFRVGEIVVQAARPLTTIGGAAAIEIRVDSVRLSAAPTLDQLLRTFPLVQVRTNSRGEAQFSLRGSGSDAREVAVLVDGLPLNLGWDDRADLSVLPSTAARTITLARGLPSLLYGPNVLGGVLEIGVAAGSSSELNPRSVRMDAGADHTGARAFSSTLTLPVQLSNAQLLLRAGGGYRERDGVALPDGVAEPAPASDPELRLNTGLVQRDGFAALRYQRRSGAWTSLTTSGYTAQRGIPAELHIQGARFWRYPAVRRAFAVLAGGTGEKTSPFGGIGDVEVSAGLDAGHTEIDQYTSRAYDTISANEDSDDHNYSFRLRADQTTGSAADLRSAITYSDVRHHEVLTPGATSDYRQRLWSAASELAVRAGDLGGLRAIRLTAGAAYDGADTPETGDKPTLGRLHAWGARAGLTMLSAKGKLLLHAGASRRSRFPALRELYSGALGKFEPNPGLRPERLTAAEVGSTLSFKHGVVQAVGFRHVLADAIVRVATPSRKLQRVNRDRQSATGLELLATLAAGPVSLGGELVLQQTTITDQSAGAESEPEYQPDVLAGSTLTARLPWQLRLDTRVRYTGRQSCVNPETSARTGIAPATRFDAEVARSWSMQSGWTSQAELSVAADNLSDRTIYDQCGLPQPGRTVRIQVRVR